MPSVIAEITKWAKTLPFWEQAALDKILAGAPLNDPDYEEILDYLLEDTGLLSHRRKRYTLAHLDAKDPTLETQATSIVLKRIFNLQNINALVSGQALTFGPGLTAIFGENGSGKSGYARVLGRAGFTRGDAEILPDVTKRINASTVLSADIEITCNGSAETIHYRVGDDCPRLSECYVFDSTSVHVHLTGSNTFSFSPAGLFILTRLSDATDKVREALHAKIEANKQPHTLGSLFQGNTAVTEFIKTLDSKTDLQELRKLATLSVEENQSITKLDYEIAELKTKDIPKQIQKINQTIEDLHKLTTRLATIECSLNDAAMSTVRSSVKQYLERESLSQKVSTEQFKTKSLTQIGTDAWYKLAVSAKALADLEASPSKPYPQIGAPCLLCHRPLDDVSRQLLLKIWEYLESDARLKLDQSAKMTVTKRESLVSLDLDFFTDQWVSFRHLKENDKELLEAVSSFLIACHVRRTVALSIIDLRQDITLPTLPHNQVGAVNTIIDKLTAELLALTSQNIANRILEKAQELLTLEHRKILSNNLPKVEAYLQNVKWADRASTVGGDTRHITQKYKDLFERLVTTRYLDIFQSTLKDLQRPINVKVKTVGKKGKTYKQIALEVDPSATGLDNPDKVLSEGEKRAVALADFLTEVALDTDSSSIILDDPVTSLDLEWKQAITAILVREARGRQVIVFTHDLPFLYLLKRYAQENTVEILTHWIQRVDSQPGYVFLNNSPALEKEYCKPTRAREFFEVAKRSVAGEQEKNLRSGFGALRSSYEAFIIYELLAGVVLRFDVRVSPGRLKDVRWDNAMANEVISKYEKLSGYMEGHLQADGYTSKPTPAILFSEIEAFEALRKRLNVMKAA